MTGVPVCIVTTVVKILGKVHVESMFMFLLLLLLTEAVQPVFSTTARPATPDAGLHEEGGDGHNGAADVRTIQGVKGGPPSPSNP
jgi:hypothetical protein